MDPNTLPTPSFDLPQPQSPGEWQSGSQPKPPEQPISKEQGSAEGLQASAPAPMPAATPAPAQANLPQHLTPQLTQPSPVPGASTAGLSADDSDLIEKEWVEKAKRIVEQNREDPYAQNKEMNKVKAEYIKKRYNKDIKVNEE